MEVDEDENAESSEEVEEKPPVSAVAQPHTEFDDDFDFDTEPSQPVKT